MKIKENKQNSEEKLEILLEKKNLYEQKLIEDDKFNNIVQINEEKEFLYISINNNEITKKEEIVEIFEKKGGNFKEYKNNLEKNNISIKILQSLQQGKKKRKKNKKLENVVENDTKKCELKRGRKKKGDNTKRHHDKNSPDNIFKKVKDKLLVYLVISINIILKNIGYEENKLYKLDYKELVNKKSDKKCNLELLNMPIKDLLSMKISAKYKTISNPTNKNVNILEQICKEGANDDIIKYIFKISFKDWIDIFTLKRESNIKHVKFEGLDSLLEEIYKNKDLDSNYFCNFIFCLYNYERYWLCKRIRKNKLNC